MISTLRTFRLVCLLLLATPAYPAEPTAEQFATALVEIDSVINPDGRTVATLGAHRSGSGVVIDTDGLIVTVGYLLLEATEVTVSFYTGLQLPANIVSVDPSSGLALLRIDAQTEALPAVRPLKLGKSALLMTDERVIVMPAGGVDVATSVTVHSIREFAAPWEYLLDRAIYTTPPLRNFSGAALINRDAELVGVGTLALQNVTDASEGGQPGNVFIPVDLLAERLGLLLADVAHGRAWLGLMIDRQLTVTRVLDESPADQAGVQQGDIIVGLDNTHVLTRPDLYRLLWSAAETQNAKQSLAEDSVESKGDSAGSEKQSNTPSDIQNDKQSTATLLVSRDSELIPIEVLTTDRSSWLAKTQ